MADAAGRIATLAEEVLGTPLPIRVRAWDQSETGPPGAPTLVIRRRRALRRLLWRPGELGLARGWVAGDLDVEGDLYEALDRLSGLLWERGPAGPPRSRLRTGLQALRDPALRTAARRLIALAGPGLPPTPPREEVRTSFGPVHSLRRDRKAISHHYDVGNDFYELVLGPSMVYSCAYWDGPDSTLEEAQRAKLDLVCRKLALKPGQRLLDVGCGWGSMVLHAAREYGVSAVGVTLSEEQAAYARKRVADQGLTDQVEIRVQDYREVPDGPYDAISSIGMAEHVGAVRYAEYTAILHGLLRPGGRLLNHQIARRPQPDEEAYHVDEFIDRYVFPDGELAPVGRTVTQLEAAGFEVRDVEAIREHYALTLRRWVANLERSWARGMRLTSPGRARVWRLYMAASALSFERNRIGVNQILAVRTPEGGASGLPLRARDWR
ncbi:SAM-dependent methyltransferase [Streptomyces malaysiensis]|uniref:SAM-dependent methyltransferase n=1 Tax=Streptomyces autolyticus TaxID=75293 RepID=A0ABM6HEG2_9ACTN|nr:cyclopropane-fatty-acyl-phospholipid synthase family protein [Streptomyces autolyticus]AQA12316.1 SAM-dependent methyltransferase [Streptomyces autolyticus]MCC4318182.1 cyclopropane-fatty-acyl-phospholipid synthase family protein [Streptomyces malaysiensis]MCQ6249915.1 cyclopropane-fatty-acyl-phospholipid synthase family protein [Streptomyces malaysiensis]